jgi:hypothetical protein
MIEHRLELQLTLSNRPDPSDLRQLAFGFGPRIAHRVTDKAGGGSVAVDRGLFDLRDSSAARIRTRAIYLTTVNSLVRAHMRLISFLKFSSRSRDSPPAREIVAVLHLRS